MSEIAVQKINGGGSASPAVFEEVKELFERVRQRAFDLFQSRKGGPGTELDDWLTAERDLIWAPESEFVEKDGKFEIQIAVPGFDVKDMQVAATRGTLLVRAAKHKHEKGYGNFCLCEEKELFRRFEFPKPIDVDKVKANLDKGVLYITAAKAEEAKEKKVAVAAAA